MRTAPSLLGTVVALATLVGACGGSSTAALTTTVLAATSTSISSTSTVAATTSTSTTPTTAVTVVEYGLITAMTPTGSDFTLVFDPVVWEPNGPGTCGDGSPCWDNPKIEAVPYTMPTGSTSSVLVWDATGNIAAQAGVAADLYGYAFGTYCASNLAVCPPPPVQFSPVWIITHDGAGTILDVLNQYVP